MRSGARPRAQGPQTQEATRITTPGLLPLLGYKDRETGLEKGISPDSKQQHTWDLGMHLRPPGGPDACRTEMRTVPRGPKARGWPGGRRATLGRIMVNSVSLEFRGYIKRDQGSKWTKWV